MSYGCNAGGTHYVFTDLRMLLARASPDRAGDRLAGLAAESGEERVAARMALADLPLARFLDDPLVPYEMDEVTRLILDTHDKWAFAPIAAMTTGEFRDFLLSDAATSEMLARLAPGITPEMAAGVSKLMRNQDLIAVAKKLSVVTRFRTTIGLPGCLCVRIQPNHPADDLAGIGAAILDGLMYGCGDACIGINPASDSAKHALALLERIEELRLRFEIPVQSCVLAHVTTTMQVMEREVRSIWFFSRSLGPRRPTARSAWTSRFWTKPILASRRCTALRPAPISCISKPARARRYRRKRITASINKPWKRAPMRWRGATRLCS